jgi:hypothetical protein
MDGTEMTEENWNEDFAKSLAVFLNGKALRMKDEKGKPLLMTAFLSFLMLLIIHCHLHCHLKNMVRAGCVPSIQPQH